MFEDLVAHTSSMAPIASFLSLKSATAMEGRKCSTASLSKGPIGLVQISNDNG